MDIGSHNKGSLFELANKDQHTFFALGSKKDKSGTTGQARVKKSTMTQAQSDELKRQQLEKILED